MPKKNNPSPYTSKPRSIRFSPSIEDAMKRVSEEEFRTPTDFIRMSVVEALRARGIVVS